MVTDKYVSGSYSPKRVLNTLKSKKIGVSVIGRDEPFQKMLVQGTGGLCTNCQFVNIGVKESEL